MMVLKNKVNLNIEINLISRISNGETSNNEKNFTFSNIQPSQIYSRFLVENNIFYLKF